MQHRALIEPRGPVLCVFFPILCERTLTFDDTDQKSVSGWWNTKSMPGSGFPELSFAPSGNAHRRALTSSVEIHRQPI